MSVVEGQAVVRSGGWCSAAASRAATEFCASSLQARPGRGGRLNEAQAAMREHLERCGFEYLMTDDIDQASGGEP